MSLLLGPRGQSPGWLLHLFTLLYLYVGLLQSHTATVSNLPIFPLLLLSESHFWRKAKKYGFVFRFWKCTRLHCRRPPPFNFIRLSLHKYQPAELWIHWDLYPGSPVRFNAFWMSIQPYASPGDKIRVRALSEDWQTTISQNYFQEKNVCKTSLRRKNKNHIRSCFPKIW